MHVPCLFRILRENAVEDEIHRRETDCGTGKTKYGLERSNAHRKNEIQP